MTLVGPLAGIVRKDGRSIDLYAEQGYEARIRNCASLYLTLAKHEHAAGWVALDPPWDGPHVFALIDNNEGAHS